MFFPCCRVCLETCSRNEGQDFGGHEQSLEEKEMNGSRFPEPEAISVSVLAPRAERIFSAHAEKKDSDKKGLLYRIFQKNNITFVTLQKV